MKRFRLGDHSRRITTTSPEAQGCVMADWGVAYGSGPFYNHPWRHFGTDESEARTRLCHNHIQRARHSAREATEIESELVEALASRFQKPHAVALDEFDRWDDDYRDAMRSVYEHHRSDHDVMALFVEALITRTPWRLWDVKTGLPAEGADTEEALDVCERSIALADEQGRPPHPASLHLHIHILEMSDEPERAMRSADLLGPRPGDAGHLRHMPGHIYVLCGEYEKAKAASALAIRADDMYVEYAGPHNFYTASRCHDLHLMMYTCMFLGRYEDSLAAANRICETLTEEVLGTDGRSQLAMTLEGYHSMRMHVLVRFGRWQEIIDTPVPANPDLYCVSTAMHHYATGVARATLGRITQAAEDRRLFHESLDRVPRERRFFNNSAKDILAVAEKILDGELAYHLGNHEEAFGHLRDAVRRDDDLEYTEPWAWMHPPRHALATLLLEQGHHTEAEALYRADLGMDDTLQRCAQHPDNVWSLHGLVECLEKRSETTERVELERRLVRAMAHTDVDITSSCMCRGGCACGSE